VAGGFVIASSARVRFRPSLKRIGSACPLADPAPQVADGLSAVMFQDFHFSPPPPDPAAKPAGAVTLEVRTATFTRSSRIHWEGAVAFRALR
jgi:hypothetical protein